MRIEPRPCLAAAAAFSLGLLGAACGGGGMHDGHMGTGAAPSVTLTGRVLERDGSTSDLGGVRILLPSTGATVVTAADGSFDFGLVPAGTLTLRVTDPAATVVGLGMDMGGSMGSGGMGGGMGSGGASGFGTPMDDMDYDMQGGGHMSDPAGDGDAYDTGDDDCDMADVAAAEAVEVCLTIRGGMIESMDFARSGHHAREAEVWLARTAETDDPDVVGCARLASSDAGQRLGVRVERALPGRGLRTVLVSPDGATADLGVVTVDAQGGAVWQVDTARGGVLPFSATTVDDLAGCGIEVRDATNALVLLVGTLPEVPLPVDDRVSTRAHGMSPMMDGPGAMGEARMGIDHGTGLAARDAILAAVSGAQPGTVIDVWMEDPASPGTLREIGQFTVGGTGDGSCAIDTQAGGTLPFGATSVASLVGLRVELRDASDGTVLYSGTVPDLVMHR